MTFTHDDLVIKAERWLKRQGCGVVIRDPFKVPINREQPDAIGWRDGLSILVECKVSRADFVADLKKPFRSGSIAGMGDWRFYLSPPDMIKDEDLPKGWGLLWLDGRSVKVISGAPSNAGWWSNVPFRGCKRSENAILVSAMRRLTLKGYGAEIYNKRAIVDEHGSNTA